MLLVFDHTTASKGAPVSMLTREDDVDAHALRKRGWTISAIARHLGHDRKTIRAYLAGERSAGVRQRAVHDPFDLFEAYVRARLAEDPHLWATVLFDEIVALGFDRSYSVFTHQVRSVSASALRTVRTCATPAGGGDRASAGRGDAMGLAGSA